MEWQSIILDLQPGGRSKPRFTWIQEVKPDLSKASIHRW